MDNSYENSFKENLTKGDRREYWNNKSSFDFFMEQNFDKNVRILEIWCNIWTLVNMLYQAWYKNITGIDVTPTAIELWKKKYTEITDNLSLYDWETLPFKDSSFDLVISFDVLEHIPNTNKHLEEVKRVLRNWWKYIWQTPNKIINIPREIINSNSFTKWKTYHCSLQTHWSLRNIFRKNWFKNIDIKKRKLCNDYNKKKAKKKLWYIWLFLLKLINSMPIYLQTNFWFKVIK
jgi:SAM-dependent methyltransferase